MSYKIGQMLKCNGHAYSTHDAEHRKVWLRVGRKEWTGMFVGRTTKFTGQVARAEQYAYYELVDRKGVSLLMVQPLPADGDRYIEPYPVFMDQVVEEEIA